MILCSKWLSERFNCLLKEIHQIISQLFIQQMIFFGRILHNFIIFIFVVIFALLFWYLLRGGGLLNLLFLINGILFLPSITIIRLLGGNRLLLVFLNQFIFWIRITGFTINSFFVAGSLKWKLKIFLLCSKSCKCFHHPALHERSPPHVWTVHINYSTSTDRARCCSP